MTKRYEEQNNFKGTIILSENNNVYCFYSNIYRLFYFIYNLFNKNKEKKITIKNRNKYEEIVSKLLDNNSTEYCTKIKIAKGETKHYNKIIEKELNPEINRDNNINKIKERFKNLGYTEEYIEFLVNTTKETIDKKIKKTNIENKKVLTL
jgi:hypothetical protein